VFESGERLVRDVVEALCVLRTLADGRHACLLEPGGILLEDPADSADQATLKAFLTERSAALFALPAAMASGGPMDDVLGDWDDDEFLLAFLNGKVAVVVACPDAEALRRTGETHLTILVDRLFRWKPAYRLDPQGRGLFVSAPRLDIVVVGRPGE
jgi:hypothetical protein